MKAIPLVGLGTWELRGKKCEEVVALALDIGYRHLDTAHIYENHAAIGNVIKNFPRKDLFVTSKFILDQLQSQSVEETCDEALKDLRIDYLDHYLMHWPDRTYDFVPIFSDLEMLKKKGKIKGWGVSNCTIHHLQDYLSQGFHPEVNQVEFHPYLYQKDLLVFCNKEKIRLISYRTLGKGALVTDPTFEKIAKKHKKTVPQILLRWCVEKNIPVIPKASSEKHLKEDIAILDFHLDQEDMSILDHMVEKPRFANIETSDFNY